MKLRKLVTALGVGLGLVVAAPAGAGVTWFPFPTITGFEDDDLDFVLDPDGKVKTTGTINVGDTLVSVFEVNSTFPIGGPGGSAPIAPDELTGVAVIKLVSKTADLDGIGGANDWIFGPSPLYATLLRLPDLSPGDVEIAAMWLDDSPDLEIVPPNCTTLADCVARARDGELFQVDGFKGEFGEYWVALNVSTDSIDIVRGLPATAKVATANFALSTFFNKDGRIIPQTNVCLFTTLASPCGAFGNGYSIDMIGSGDILGGQGLAGEAIARSDFDFQKTIPEPATLALIGAGLLGLGVGRRKLQNA